MIEFFKTVIIEMTKGNFSFLILVVGVIQIFLMIANLKVSKKKKDGGQYNDK